MGKTLWSLLIIQATLILLLKSSHAKTKYVDTATRNNSADITEQFALDIINLIYNLHSNGTYSKIINNGLKVLPNMAYGQVELRPTTCTQAESALDECPFKTKLLQLQKGHIIIGYRKVNRTRKPCSKFLSELSSCPFSEHPEHQKRESCSFRIYTHPFSGNRITIKFNCQNV